MRATTLKAIDRRTFVVGGERVQEAREDVQAWATELGLG